MARSYSLQTFSVLLFSIICTVLAVELDVDSQPVIFLSHSIGSAENFESRGQINIRSLKTGSVAMQSTGTVDTEALQKAAAENDFYHLEAIVKTPVGDRVFRTSTRACLMYESQLSDIITVHVDTLGNIYGISLSTANSQCGSETVTNIDPNFNTTVLISHMELGPIPDTAMYVQKMEQEKIAKERGETKDNRSFIAKYWMYILPIVLVFMMSGASNPEQGGNGGGGGGASR